MPGVVYEFSTKGGADVVRLWENIGRAGQQALGGVQDAAKRTQVSLEAIPLAIKAIPSAARDVPRSLEDIRRAAGVVGREADTAAGSVHRLFAELKGGALQAEGLRNAGTGVARLSQGISEAAAAASASAVGRGGFSVLTGALAALGPAAIAGAAAAGLATVTKRAIENAAALKDEAAAVDLNVEKYQQLRFAFQQAGVGQDQFAILIQTFVRNIGDAQRGAGGLVRALKDTDPALLRFLQGTSSVDDKVTEFFQHLLALPSATEKASLGAAAMGEGFRPVVGILNGTETGLAALMQRASETGNVLSDELLTSAQATERQMAVLSTTLSTNLQRAVLDLSGPLEGLTKLLANGAAAAGAFISGIPQGTRAVGGEIDALTKKIAQLESALGNLSGPKTLAESLFGDSTRQGQRQSLVDDILKLNQDRDRALQARTDAAATTDAERKRASEFVGPPTPTQAQEQAQAEAERERKRAQEDELREAKRQADALADLRKQVEEKGTAAALAGIDDRAEKAKAAGEAEIKRFTEEVRDRVADAKQGDQLIADFRVGVEKDVAAEVAKVRKEEADKQLKEDQAFWDKEFRLDQENVQRSNKELEDAAKNAERDAKDRARTAERQAQDFARPFLNAADDISRNLSDALVNSLLAGENQARSTADVIKAEFADVAQSLIADFLRTKLRDVVQNQLGGLLGNLGGGAPEVTAQPGGGFGLSTVSSSASALGGQLAAVAGIATSLAGALYALNQQASSLRKASGGQRGGSNALLAIGGVGTGLGVGLGAGIGAAVGSIFPGIGTAIGAGLGAAVGGAISAAISQSVASNAIKGINTAVNKGLDQAGLEKQVVGRLQSDLLLNILSGGANAGPLGFARLLGPLVVPDIEKIFAKEFRRALGGIGGFSTTGIPVGAQGNAGLPQLVGQGTQASRIIAEAFGAGGEAFGAERASNFRAILLGAVRKRLDRVGGDAEEVLGQAFVTAFDGIFLNAVRTAFSGGPRRREQDVRFVAQEFSKGQGLFGFDFARLGQVIQDQGIVPQGQARKASREAVGKAFEAALADAADSSAFRKSLAGSVEDAFVGKATTVLDKGFGQLFAPFFALGKDARRDFRRARRRGDLPGALDVLSQDFGSKVDAFAQQVSDPAFASALAKLTDEFLHLQVATSIASGDIQEAADAIQQRLAPQIKLVRDAAQLQRDVRSRTAIALAGPGFAAERAQIADLTLNRQDIEQRFKARFGVRASRTSHVS